MAGIKSNILQNLQELTKDIPSKKLLKFPVYDYNEEQSSLERAKQSAKKIKKLEIWNSEADAFTTAASVRPETLIAALSEPGSPKSEKKIKKPKEARYQSIKGQKINKKAGKAPENFSEKEKSGLLDLFVKTQKFQTYGFKEGAPETEMQTSILIEPDNGERAPKIDLRPASVALVADRKNYEKTRHRESSALFEFSLAKEKALATAFSDRPFLSADELFREVFFVYKFRRCVHVIIFSIT